MGFFKLNSVLAQIFGAPFQSDWIKCINQISYIEYTQSCDWLEKAHSKISLNANKQGQGNIVVINEINGIDEK